MLVVQARLRRRRSRWQKVDHVKVRLSKVSVWAAALKLCEIPPKIASEFVVLFPCVSGRCVNLAPGVHPSSDCRHS